MTARRAPMPQPTLNLSTATRTFSFLHGASPVEAWPSGRPSWSAPGSRSRTTTGSTEWCFFAPAAGRRGVRPVIGLDIELRTRPLPTVASWSRRGAARSRRGPRLWSAASREGLPSRPRPDGPACRVHRATVKEDLRGIAERPARAAPRAAGARRHGLPEPLPARLPRESRRDQARPRFTQALLEQHTDGLIALSGAAGRDRAAPLVGDREGAKASARRHGACYGTLKSSSPTTSSRRRLASSPEHVGSPTSWGLPVVVTNDATRPTRGPRAP